MSLRAIVEFFVHLEDFRNIDFYNQGLYYFRVSVWHEKGGERFFSMPYRCHENEVPRTTEGKNFRV